MDEPDSFSGILSSPIATLGPLAYQRTSLTIFINAPASLRTLRPRRAQTVPRSCSLQTQMVDGSLQRSDGSDFAEAGMSVDARADCRSSGDQRENSRKSLSNSGQRLVELRYPGDQLKVRPAHHDDVAIRVGVRIQQITHLGHGRVRRHSIVSTVAMCMTVGKVSFADWRELHPSL